MNGETNGNLGEKERAWHAGENEFANLGLADGKLDGKPPRTGAKEFLRTNRTLQEYKEVFGEDFGKHDELILDLGAGDATVADEIAELTDHKARVTRLDLDYLDQPPEGRAPAIAADATKLPFANDSFDRIVSYNVMFYLGREQAERAMAESMRVLKPGGEALCMPILALRKATSEIAREEGQSNRRATLAVSKPADYDTWDPVRKEKANHDMARALARGKITTQFIRKTYLYQTALYGGYRISQVQAEALEHQVKSLEKNTGWPETEN